MSIDQLPDDCLLHIFNLLNRFDTLLNCSKVCERWKGLVFERLRNVQYLTDVYTKVDYPAGNTMIFQDYDRFEGIQVSEWFAKLKILAVYRNLDVNFVSNLKVKGLILTSYSERQLENVTLHNPSLEMLAISHICSFFANEIQGPIMKQLYITGCNVSHFARYAKYFPNLKRLHIDEFVRDPSEDTFYTGPVLEKLEILEICFNAQIEPCDYYGFSLADHCPALKSAFHYIETYQEFFVDSGIKNHFLEDLVIEFSEFQDWSVLRRILSKYPNLKHLAFRGGADISDENIPELLLLLPRIILIDIRDSEQVTEKSTEYIDRYCRHHDRSISFYYRKRPKITKKWPHLTIKDVCIGRGFDFIKYCFLRNYDDLPLLLDPDE